MEMIYQSFKNQLRSPPSGATRLFTCASALPPSGTAAAKPARIRLRASAVAGSWLYWKEGRRGWPQGDIHGHIHNRFRPAR